MPEGVHAQMFFTLPVIALAGAMTAALYVPVFGLDPSYSFPGDLIVTIYLLSLLTLCMGLAGANTLDRFSLIGATRTLTQLFSYEAPFLLALLGPAIVAGSWQIGADQPLCGEPLADPDPAGRFCRRADRADGQAGTAARSTRRKRKPRSSPAR